MTENTPLSADEQFHYDAAWNAMRIAWDMYRQKRRARAQEFYNDARYHAHKVPARFTDPDLDHNLEKIGSVLSRGY